MTSLADLPEPTDGSLETRERLVVAAREVFQTDGFDRASTRAIASAAGVNSALIFRYFGSKAGLYEVAVLQPLQAFIDDYVEGWNEYESQPHTADRGATEYLGGLYDLFRDHRELVLALVHRRPPGAVRDAEEAQIARWIVQLLDGVQRVVDIEAERRGWSGYLDEGGMSLRMSLGLAFSMATLEDWIWPDDHQHPSREQIIASMTSFVLRSMSNPGGAHGFPCD